MEAPGGPGATPTWGPGRKQGFGAAPGPATRVWFTIARGNLSEVFYPRLDWPALNSFRFLVAAPGAPPIDDATDAQHRCRWLEPGIPAFVVETEHAEYRLRKEYACHPDRDAVVVSGEFLPALPDLRLYVHAVPHPDRAGQPNDAFVLPGEPPVLLARQGDVWIAIAGPFRRATAGYLNSSDIYVDLHDGDGEMSVEYSSATAGSVSVGAELGVDSGPFQIAIAFDGSRDAAAALAQDTLRAGAGRLREDFVRCWRRLSEPAPNLLKASGDGGALARASLTVLRCLEDSTFPGAFVAAPCAPWGETRSDSDHVYNLVWPRDLYHIATALIDLGDLDAGSRALEYLSRTQSPEGDWPRNFSLEGFPHWSGPELDEVALPILLTWRLARLGALDHDPYPRLIRPAALHLLRHGPATPYDRWEDAGGLSPSTLAVAIAALCVAAEFADDAGESRQASYVRAVADYWNDRVEAWSYVSSFRHFVRLGQGADLPADPTSAVALEFLELARHGVRHPSDPRLLTSVTTADVLLRSSIPGMLAWRRYVGDTYGESDDGRPWSPETPGTGRCWPLLTGEVAHHALALGQPVSDLVAAMESFAGPELMLPEQVWDGPELPPRELWPGQPSGSAAPLGWAHAEYLRLLAAISSGEFPDIVGPALRRYGDAGITPPAFIWSEAHPITRFEEDRSVLVQLDRPAVIRWSADGWTSSTEVTAEDTGLGLWVARLPTETMRPDASVEWTALFDDGREDVRYRLTCVAAAPSRPAPPV